MLSITPNLQIPLDEFEFTYARSGGPGGQNVNKVNSKAVLRWRISQSPSLTVGMKARFAEKYSNRLTTDGELVLSSQRYRDQAGNVQDCLEKLTSMVASIAERPELRRATKPTLAANRTRVEQKRGNSMKKQQRRAPQADY